MALEVKTTMRWRVCTCGCVIDYELRRDGTDYTTSTMTPINIAAKCSAHVLAITPAELDALVVPENEALARAAAIISRDRSSNDRANDEDASGLRNWSINDQREVVIDDVGTDVSHGLLLGEVPNIVFATEMASGGREPATWIGPDIAHSYATTQRVIQGNVQHAYTFHYATWLEYADYFPIVGNGILEIMYVALFSGWTGEDPRYRLTKHVVNFAGIIDFFTVKISANMRTKDVHYRARVNDVDTEQWCMVPAWRMGVFTCIGEAATYESGDTLVGYCSSERVTPVYNDLTSNNSSYINLRAVHCELQPTTGYHTMFRASGNAGLAHNASLPAVVPGSAYPLGGALFHYWTDLTQGDGAVQLAAAESRMEMLVRAPGTFSHLQAALDPPLEETSNFQFRRDQASAEGGNPFPSLQFPSDAIATEYRFDVDSTPVDVSSGEMVAILANSFLVTEETGGTLVWGVGVNWTGALGNNLIDHQVTESYVDSMTNSLGDRANKFNYISETPEGEHLSEWWASPIGAYHPKPRHLIRAMPLGWDDILVRTSFQMEIIRLRAFCDENQDGRPVRVGIGIGTGDPLFGAAVGNLDAEVDAVEAWAEDALSRDEVSIGDGFCLRFKGQPIDPTAKIHISTVVFSYRATSASGGGDGDGRDCVPRDLPDAVAVTPEPCLTHRARCVQITRTDDEVFAYTEHDNDIVYNGVTYLSRRGFTGSATELGSVIGDVGNMEIAGFTSSLGITAADLFGGKFDGARVVVRLIPWGSYQATENVIVIGGGVIGTVDQDGKAFRMEALSMSAYLKQQALVQTYTPSCRFTLGDSRCSVTLTPVTGSVTALTVEAVVTGATVRRRFKDSTRDEDAGWFDEGEVTFTGGANVGQTSKVKAYAPGAEIVLWEPLVYPIEIGDAYSMKPGCNKLVETCETKFDNLINFGGYPTVPGSDATLQTPTGKMGS